VTLSGASTYTGTTSVKGGTLALDGANRIAAGSALNLAGGTLALQNAGGPNGQTFAGLTVTGNSALDLGQSSVTFADLGSVDAGKTLTVIGWSDTTSPAYAFRFVGDRSASADFQALIGITTINGFAAGYTVEGGYTNVIPTPLPAALPLLLSGLGVFGAVVRRRRVGAAPG
jgi:autotransporter-associated beta strand protein